MKTGMGVKEYSQDIRRKSEAYRPLPFWSWNDRLEPEFLSWQIEEMAKAGLGGYFMHARSGIETEYLSEEWFECIHTGVKDGLKNGLAPWIYDEAGWPSGFAGGAVTAKGDKYHARGLRCREIASPAEAAGFSQLLGVYSVNKATGELKKLMQEETGAQDGFRYYAVTHTSCPYYIDILNPEVTAAFIECTHQRYYDRFAKDFGAGIRGFFTDEPRLSEGPVPWSYIIPERFSKKFGYDVMNWLPAMYVPVKGYERVRYDFWKLVSELFVNSFMKQIYDWCTAHNCELTGHMMMEESIYSQMTGTSGSMPFYEFMHMPGVDWLRRPIANSSIVPKQVGSVAEQLGKEHVLTESYALSGWNVNFQELRRIADWQLVNGVNTICQHLEGYTLRGLRKRDYPPSLFYQQPWWPEYKSFNDYLCHMGAVVTSGKKLIDVLILHPMHSGWIAYDGTNNTDVKQIDHDFETTVNTVAGSHADYHFGDETIIQRHGSVEGNEFAIGSFRYRVVVLPSMLSLDESTLTLLEQFAAGGGSILSAGRFPTLCGGVPSARLEALQAKVLIADTPEKLAQSVSRLSGYSVSVAENGKEVSDIHLCQIDTGDGCRSALLVNHSDTARHTVVVSVPGCWNMELFSAETLEAKPLQAEYKDGKTCVSLYFFAMQSHILRLSPAKRGILPDNADSAQAIRIDAARGAWKIADMGLNALTLDCCEYQIDGGEWKGPIAIIHLMDQLLALKRPCDIALRFGFDIDADMNSIHEFLVAVEQAEGFAVRVNGITVEYRDIGWWKDSAFKKIDIRKFIKAGHNTIELSRRFYQSPKVYEVLFGENVYETELNKLTYDTELESIYLLGDFGVYSKDPYTELDHFAMRTPGNFVIKEQPKLLQPGDFTKQGLCFFTGRLVLEKTIKAAELQDRGSKRVILDLGTPHAEIIKAAVNGKAAAKFLWEPFTADVTDFVQDDEIRLTLTVYSSNRNLFGPHHHINGEVFNVGPLSFTGKWSWCEQPTEGVEIKDSDRTKWYWTDDYCFVEFGV